MKTPKYHIFVCSSSRPQGEPKGACQGRGAAGLLPYLEEEIADRGLGDLVVTNTGCFKLCEYGPILAVYPQGWFYGGVDEDAVDLILDALEKDEPATELLLSAGE